MSNGLLRLWSVKLNKVDPFMNLSFALASVEVNESSEHVNAPFLAIEEEVCTLWLKRRGCFLPRVEPHR